MKGMFSQMPGGVVMLSLQKKHCLHEIVACGKAGDSFWAIKFRDFSGRLKCVDSDWKKELDSEEDDLWVLAEGYRKW